MMSCVACNNASVLKRGVIEGYIEGSFYTIFECSSCKTSFSDPHVSGDKVYDLIYSHKDDTPGYARYSRYAYKVLGRHNPLTFLSNMEEMYYGVRKSLRKNVHRNARILDVGCGLGYFTYALNKAGYSATGLDISQEAVQKATEAYGAYFLCKDFFSLTLETSGGGYDAICMLELIEHVDDPQAYVKHALSLLKPRGVLIMTTPNKNWYPPKTIWESDLPPVHITWFSEEGMIALGNLFSSAVTHVSFATYNISRGSILKPEYREHTRGPFFSKEGDPLFPAYRASRLKQLAKKARLYFVLLRLRSLWDKCKEIWFILSHFDRMSLSRSHTQCVVLTKVS